MLKIHTGRLGDSENLPKRMDLLKPKAKRLGISHTHSSKENPGLNTRSETSFTVIGFNTHLNHATGRVCNRRDQG